MERRAHNLKLIPEFTEILKIHDASQTIGADRASFQILQILKLIWRILWDIKMVSEILP